MEFRILGPLEVWQEGRRLRLTPSREQRVLAALLLDVNRPVGVPHLIDVVWDHSPPESATKAIRNCVSTLRQWLAEKDGAGQQTIITDNGNYLIRVSPPRLDAQVFADRVTQARQLATSGQPDQAVRELRAALTLWRGPALSGIGSKALDVGATRLNEQRTAVLIECFALELALGKDYQLISELNALVAEQPLQERLRAQLMLSLCRSGRRSEALEVYRQGRQILVTELGIEPCAELQSLEKAILTDDARLAATETQAQPDRVLPAQLPANPSAFTGRGTELRELASLLPNTRTDSTTVDRRVPILAITGTAGVGKTALAVHWAHHVRDHFPDGQLFTDLHGYATTEPVRPLDVLGRFLQALGVAGEKVPSDLEAAADMYRTLLADRRMLILLDNVAGPEQVRPLLPGSRGCLVVVTSRDRLAGLLAREGARRLTLDVLCPTEANTLLARVVGHERVHAEPAAASALARTCAHLPLAIRIAAANLASDPYRSLADYVAELQVDSRLTALEVGDDPQAAVRAAFDISYTKLAPGARRMFRRLGLAPGAGITPAAAAALIDADQRSAVRLLDQLAAAHLVHRLPADRFAFHDLLRSYAADRAATDDNDATRQAAVDRMHDWYLRHVDGAARLLYPHMLRLPGPDPYPYPYPSAAPLAFADPAAALAWMDAERANLVALISRAAQQGPHRIACLLGDGLRGYFHLRRLSIDWRTIAHACLRAATATGDALAQAAAWLSLADAEQRSSRFSRAVEYYLRAVALDRQCGWLDGEAVALGNLGYAYWQLGQLQRAADYLIQAQAIDERTGRLGGAAVHLSNLGAVCRQWGRLDEAADHQRRALDLHRQLGSPLGEATALGNLGETYHALGRHEQARAHLTSALAVHRATGDHGCEAETLRILAAVYRDAGQHERALDHAQNAVIVASRIGDRRTHADALNTYASIQRHLGRPAQAATHHRQALGMARSIKARYQEAEALVDLAGAYLHLGDPEAALAHAQQALIATRDAGYRILEGRALTNLATIHLHTGDYDQAATCAGDALDILRRAGNHQGMACAEELLRQTEASRRHLPSAPACATSCTSRLTG